MEQHPVPQNVTTFQFRLIGDMTIKQFGYLAGGATLGYICYKLPLPFFFTWPLAVLSVCLGIGLAFVPIEERPMDVWLLSFIKSIYSPTQYLWSRQTEPKAGQKMPRPKEPPVAPVARSSSDFLKKLFAIKPPQPTPPTQTSAVAPPLPPPPSAPQTDQREKEQELMDKVKKLEAEAAAKTEADRKILELQQQLNDAVAQKNKTEQNLTLLRQRLDRLPMAPQTGYPGFPPSVRPPPLAPTSTAQSAVPIRPETTVTAGIPRLTVFPNIITGIVKDAEGSLLTGILVTIRDKDDIPVRALKTNKLGQFAASTQLPNGSYAIEIEDPRGLHFFDRITVTLNGSVLPPVEVTSKSKKQMDRSNLAKSIFGDTPI